MRYLDEPKTHWVFWADVWLNGQMGLIYCSVPVFTLYTSSNFTSGKRASLIVLFSPLPTSPRQHRPTHREPAGIVVTRKQNQSRARKAHKEIRHGLISRRDRMCPERRWGNFKSHIRRIFHAGKTCLRIVTTECVCVRCRCSALFYSSTTHFVYYTVHLALSQFTAL